MKQWYVVHTHVQKERLAQEHLERQEFVTYFPRYLKTRKHARKVEKIKAALFPRYLFVQFDCEQDRWQAIQSTVGVAHLICHGVRPTPISNHVITAIRNQETQSGLVDIPRPKLTHGQKIFIKQGPFEGYEALFDCSSDEQRVTVLLSLMNQTVKVKTSWDALEISEQ